MKSIILNSLTNQTCDLWTAMEEEDVDLRTEL